MNTTRVLLKDYTSLRIGGEADMVVVKSEEELVEAVEYARAVGSRIHILGLGTNTFFGYVLENVIVIKIEIKGMEYVTVKDSVELIVGAGEIWDDVVLETVNRGMWGLENLSLIPGTVGASPVQNIGAYGAELSDVCVSVRAYDTTLHTFIELQKESCLFGYRDSLFKHEQGRYSITSVRMKLSVIANPKLDYKPLGSLVETTSVTPKIVRELVIKTRTDKLPDYTEYPNAGSFFKNPTVSEKEGKALRSAYPDIPLHDVVGGYKIPAAWLIEYIAEMKGVRVGNVGTWPKQPLVVVNYGESTAEELMQFTQSIIEKVRIKTGVILEREVNNIP